MDKLFLVLVQRAKAVRILVVILVVAAVIIWAIPIHSALSRSSS